MEEHLTRTDVQLLSDAVVEGLLGAAPVARQVRMAQAIAREVRGALRGQEELVEIPDVTVDTARTVFTVLYDEPAIR